jgi:hypothetical protein
MQTCPECGVDREGAVRFCPGCGLDYWRVAAGQPAHPEPPPVAQSAAAGSASPLRFIVAGIVLLLVAGTGVVVVSGVLPSGVPGGRPAASIRPLTAEEAIIYAFFREVRDPGAAYEVTYEGTTTFSGMDEVPPPITTEGVIRLHADNWVGHERSAQGEESLYDIDMSVVDDVAYLREDGEEWLSGEIPDRLQPISPFRRISTVTEVDYLDKTSETGLPGHRLLITKWLGGRDYSDILRRFARIESQESRMEVVVDPRGVPSVAELELVVVATDGRDTLTITASFTYHIDLWDEVDVIEPPGPDAPSATVETRS